MKQSNNIPMKKNTDSPKKGLDISARSFITAIAMIFVLMVLTYALTFVIPGGEYARTEDGNGNLIIDTSVPFKFKEGGLPFHKWLLSPFLALGAEGGGTLIAVIAFLLVVGGIFNVLEKCGIMRYLLEKITHRFAASRYKLLAFVTLFFMSMGAFIGSFEECVPLVPIIVALSLRLGWDRLTGLTISILAAGCGFASGVCNPFTVGVAQEIAGLPMFSGMWLRFLAFLLIYALLLAFTIRHAKKIERAPEEGDREFVTSKRFDHAITAFVSILGSGIALVLLSSVLPFLRDYTMIIVAVMFLAGGITATLMSGYGAKKLLSGFGHGVVSILPAVLMILMASSIRYILVESSALDTVLYYAARTAGNMPKWAVILFIYLLVLVMNFFIASGSAKAFLLMPLILPLAQLFDISYQLCVLAFAFGDGFSNAFYPTNPCLLISLGLGGESYGKWVKLTWKFQLLNLLLTSLLLLLGLAVGYN